MSSNTVIQSNNRQVWKQPSLKFNIMLRIAGADLQITDLDIDFDIYKTNKKDPNKSTITIWNLNDTTYQRILEKTYAVDLYVWYGDDEPSLIFRGYVEKDQTAKQNSQQGRINTARGFLASTVKQDNRGGFDIPTIIELIDARVAYTEKTINKNYRSAVTSTQIIKDCINAMGIGIAKFSENLPEKTYNSYNAIGKPHVILDKICKALNIRWNISNDLIQVIAPNEQFNGTYAVLLNPNNSMRPTRNGENELTISTRLIPWINPEDWVQCDFKDFRGTEQVRAVHSVGNNYGTAGTTDIIIGFDKEKKTSEKRGRKKKNENT